MARALRVQFSGAVYHLMLRGNSRQVLFRDNRDRRLFLRLLDRYRDQFSIRVYAYLLTSRQVDLLIETTRPNLSRMMQCLGTSYVSYFNRRYNRRGTLFEGRFRSYMVDKEKDLAEATRLIHLKLRRFGGEKGRRLWSSYRDYVVGGIRRALIEPGPVLGGFGGSAGEQRRRYRRFCEQGAAGARSRAARVSVPVVIPGVARDGDEQEGSAEVVRRIMHEVDLSLSEEAGGLSERRKRRALARHLSMYLIRKHTSLRLSAIGELFGVKTTAVTQGINKMHRLLNDPKAPGEFRDLVHSDWQG